MVGLYHPSMSVYRLVACCSSLVLKRSLGGTLVSVGIECVFESDTRELFGCDFNLALLFVHFSSIFFLGDGYSLFLLIVKETFDFLLGFVSAPSGKKRMSTWDVISWGDCFWQLFGRRYARQPKLDI